MTRKIALIELTACLGAGAVLSLLMGQDANWDLRNYHLYTPFSILTGRFDQDYFAADIQTALNPTADFPYVLLAMGPLASYPRILAAVMGLWYGLLVFVVLQLAKCIFAGWSKPERFLLTFAATATAVTGAAVFSQIGSTSNDIQTGMLVLAGFLLTLHAVGNIAGLDRKILLAVGLLTGIAAGLKLNYAIYTPALCLAMLTALPWGRWIRTSAIISVGWAAGFLASYGWWGWFLEKRFQSPTFPFLNNIFHSPLAPIMSVVDERFAPKDIWQWLFYPFYWAWNEELHPILETPFRDPRMALAYIAIFGFAIWTLAKRRRKNPSPLLAPAERVTITFTVLSYIFWLVTLPIFRYAVVIEVMAVFAILIVITALGRQFRTATAKPVTLGVVLAICFVSWTGTLLIDWPRVNYGDKVFDVDMSWTKPDTLFIAVTGPTAYLAAFTPSEAHARFIASGYMSMVGSRWPVGEKSQEMVETNRGPIIVLVTKIMWPTLKNLSYLRLSPKIGPCWTVHSNLDAPLGEPVFACEAARLPEKP